MPKRWWQFWKSDDLQDLGKGSIFVYGYAVTPGSKYHQLALAVMHRESDEGLENDINVEFPAAGVIDELVKEWAELGGGVNTDEGQQAMRRREKEIGQTLNELGGIELMRSVAYKLIYADLAYESDFYVWHGIGGWQN